MGDLFKSFRPVPPEYDNRKLETLTAYERHYMELLRNYGSEIKEMGDMLRDLRAEREQFYRVDLPEIETSIREDDVLSKEAASLWIAELREGMERSFRISEELIAHYTTSNLAEFKAKMKEALDKA